MELNRRAQEESIKYREQLIKELEEAKEGTRREKEQEEEQQRARRKELQAQVAELPNTHLAAEAAPSHLISPVQGTEHSLREQEEQQEGSAQQQEAKQGWHSRVRSHLAQGSPQHLSPSWKVTASLSLTCTLIITVLGHNTGLFLPLTELYSSLFSFFADIDILGPNF